MNIKKYLELRKDVPDATFVALGEVREFFSDALANLVTHGKVVADSGFLLLEGVEPHTLAENDIDI